MKSLEEFLRGVTERRHQLELLLTPEDVDAMRNRGGMRTAEKRALLQAIARRQVEPHPVIRSYS